ncbi:MAG: hypothetical protein J0L73_06435 [Verrucomicrobia bacterium]|nr:hypothetical protein [Verrucomicrobiota bacterium]
MNDSDLDRMLKHAATAAPSAAPRALDELIMARVKVDDGRARRWRSFVQWLLLLAAISGIATAGMVGWSLASRDTTHTTPPTMELFRTGGPQ